MSTVTATVTLNAAFFQEIKEDNQRLRQLQGKLSDICCRERPIALSRFALLDLLGEFRDQLATHFALEEAFGYFDDPVDVAPHLSEQVDSLRAQHADLFLEVCQLVDRAEDLLSEHASLSGFREIAHWFCDFDERFQYHEDRENELIMDAFNHDIGVGD